ncbi:HHR127Cp [Eremothecium sinecaudum]|uniref:HHR127Cp n=1 Tax=Eremothecium sinecaudum TaxID=45286 RepID=A0A0X8HWQ7_9SACH|nr:HHR127Cp [Eremothecium sinecaudum]AMD22896.1 HHR127Cp [Eremothecium sinecaudum]
MARYYCDYCHSYLTHDTLSVRKSHLIGKNHIRLTADYYYNKANQQRIPFLFPKTKRPRRKLRNNVEATADTAKEASAARLHCETNKTKRQRRKIRQVEPTATPLKQIYANSPGFNKVFTSECRLDVGDVIKVSRLPQRANQKPGASTSLSTPVAANTTASAGRAELYKPRYNDSGSGTGLPPPLALTMWGNTITNNSIVYHTKDTLQRTAAKVKASLAAGTRSDYSQRFSHTHQR